MEDLFAAVFAATLALPLASRLHRRIFGRQAERSALLHPHLRLECLQTYRGPWDLAARCLREHGVMPQQVRALLLYRCTLPGGSLRSAPRDLLRLANEMAASGAVRGQLARQAIHGAPLPAGSCLWFVQVAGGDEDLLLCFVGPDRGLSDHA